MCTSVQVKTGAIARLCKCAQGNIGKNINGHRILLISAVQGPLALSFLVCLFVRWLSRYGNIRPNIHFFQYILALKPYDNPVPLNTKQYQVKLTKYQSVPPCTDPVDTIKYQPIPSYSDPIPLSTKQCYPKLTHITKNQPVPPHTDSVI